MRLVIGRFFHIYLPDSSRVARFAQTYLRGNRNRPGEEQSAHRAIHLILSLERCRHSLAARHEARLLNCRCELEVREMGRRQES